MNGNAANTRETKMGIAYRQLCSYSAVLLVALFATALLGEGLTWAVGVLYVTFLEELDYDTPSQVSFGVSLGTAMYNFAGLVAGILINRFGPGIVAIAGGVMVSGGLILTILSTHVYYMCFTFGVLWGSGVGFGYLAAVSALSEHFTKYRSLALGFVMSAVGVAGFGYPILIRALIGQYGWRGALLLLGGITLNLIACGAVFRRHSSPKANESSGQNENHSIVNLHIFKNYDYLIMCLSDMICLMGKCIFLVHLGAFAISRGITEDNAALLYSTLGIANIFGKLICGSLLSIPKCNGMHTYTVGLFVAGICTMLTPCAGSYVGLHVLTAVFGLFWAALDISIIDMCVLFLGPESLSSGYGYLMVFSGVGLVTGGPTASLVYEATGVYAFAMYLGGSFLVAGSLLMSIPLVRRCRMPAKSENETSTSLAVET